MRTVLRWAVAAGVLAAVAGCARIGRAPNFDTMKFDERPFGFRHNIELFEVSNGMRVALIPDATTNLATIDLRYDVGAAEDPAGRTGMAHLVEHLAFEYRATPGGPTLADELDQLTLYTNAFTSWDYTRFTETAPIENLEKVLALEGRRMEAPCAQLDEVTFRREVDVVLQENRESHAASTDALLEAIGSVYGADHPYARRLSTDEVAAATRDEFCAFVQRHYTPDRAYLVVSGDFDPARLREYIGRTFGKVKRIGGPRAPAAPARFDGRVSRHLAPVERASAMIFLPYPPWGAENIVLWDITRGQLETTLAAADEKHPWITATAVYPWIVERERVLVVAVEVDDARQLDRAVEEVIARAAALDAPHEPRDLTRLVSAWSLEYTSLWDRRETRGEWIAMFMHHTNHNWFMLQELRSLHTTNFRDALPSIARKLTLANSHVAYLLPSGERARPIGEMVSATPHAVVPWRAPVDAADADRPVRIVTSLPPRRVVDYQLGNGLRVVLAPERGSQVVEARLVFPAGKAHAPADQPFLAESAAALLIPDLEGHFDGQTLRRMAFGLDRDTVLNVGVDELTTTFTMTGSATWGDWHVWLLSWWVDHGTYGKRAMRMTRRAAEAAAEAKDADRDDEIERTLNERVYCAGHPYASPKPSAAALLDLEIGELARWKGERFRARGATLVVSGGFKVDAMRRQIAAQFGEWSGAAPPPLPDIPAARPAEEPSWFAVEAAGALQTRVLILMPSKSHWIRDDAARRVLVAMLVDELRDLREGMAATYGVRVDYIGAVAGGGLRVTALIDEHRSAEAVERMIAILDRLAADGAGQREAFVRARKKVLAQSLARTGGASAVAAGIAGSVALGGDPDYGAKLADEIARLSPAKLGEVAAADLSPRRRIVLVRGKKAAVDAVYARLGVEPKVSSERARPAKPEAPAEDAETTTETTTAETTTRDPGQHADDEEPPAPPRETRASEDELFLGSESARPGHKAGSFYLGSRQISLDEFLRLGGADDVRKRMRKRKTIRRTLLVGAAIGVVGGGGYALTARFCDAADFTVQSDLDACREGQRGRRVNGAIAAGIGVTLALVRLQLSDGTPSEEELSDIASRYNRISVTPTASPEGGGVTISGGF